MSPACASRRRCLRGDGAATRSARLIGVTAAAIIVGACSQMSPAVDEPSVTGFAAELEQNMSKPAISIEGPLDVDAAVRMAISFNEKIRTAECEAVIEEAQIRVERGGLMPDVLAETQYYRRSTQPYSRSSASHSYSTSTDLATINRNLTVSLNVLDLGLTLVRMRQAADKANIKWEAVRRVALDIAEETRATYWRAVALQVLLPKMKRLQPKIDEALDMAGKAVRDAALDPLSFINFQRDVLNARRELNDLYAQIAGADYRLRVLINAAPETELRLGDARAQPRSEATSAEADVSDALRNRPEIRQQMYQLRISEAEVHAAILNVLPGAVLTEELRSDSSSYLLKGDWLAWSARATAHLMNVVRLPEKLESIESQKAMQRQTAIEMAAAIALQVHVSRAKVDALGKTYRDAEQFFRSQQALLRQVSNSVRAGKIGEQLASREELSTVLAEVRAILAFGELQAAEGSYHAALGKLPALEISSVDQ